MIFALSIEIKPNQPYLRVLDGLMYLFIVVSQLFLTCLIVDEADGSARLVSFQDVIIMVFHNCTIEMVIGMD